MLDGLLSILAPHYCRSCGEVGAVLCENCKYNISSEDYRACFSCGVSVNYNGICDSCCLPYGRQWCVGERSEALKAVINGYKFYRMKSAATPLAALLDERLPLLPASTVIVPVPTVAGHVRQRGYDHALLLARQVARARGLSLERPLRRRTATTQRGADKATREAQAKTTFVVRGPLTQDVPYLLVDDVTTTGATLYYGAKALREAGASEVWVAAIARQPLD